MKVAWVLLVTTVLACRRDASPPPPSLSLLGTLPRTALQDWAVDCEVPIVEEQTVKGLDPEMRNLRWRKLAFQGATHRFVCKPPGWSVYVDDADQIVGLCVDDRRYVDHHSADIVDEAYVRALPLLLKHQGIELALSATAGGCGFPPTPLPGHLVRWGQYVPVRKRWGDDRTSRTTVGSRFSCCWEYVVTPQDYAGIK